MLARFAILHATLRGGPTTTVPPATTSSSARSMMRAARGNAQAPRANATTASPATGRPPATKRSMRARRRSTNVRRAASAMSLRMHVRPPALGASSTASASRQARSERATLASFAIRCSLPLLLRALISTPMALLISFSVRRSFKRRIDRVACLSCWARPSPGVVLDSLESARYCCFGDTPDFSADHCARGSIRALEHAARLA